MFARLVRDSFWGVSVLSMAVVVMGCTNPEDPPPLAPTETITTPNTPIGPRRIHPAVRGDYTTGGSASSFSHAVEYRFEFEGNATSWSSSTQASHIFRVVGRWGIRAQARCAVDTDIVSEWTVNIEVIAQPQFFNDFESPSLGNDTERVINPFFDVVNGLVFTACNDQGPSGYVGLVKNRSSTACVEPPDDNQKLGTGGPGIAVGRSSQGIDVQFVPDLSAGASISVEFQSLAGTELTIRLFDTDSVEVGSATALASPPDGTCGFPGDPRARATAQITAPQDVHRAILDTGWVIVIDRFTITLPAPSSTPLASNTNR